MTNQEYERWQRFMVSARGCWTVYPTHDGSQPAGRRSLILFYGQDGRACETGLYASIDERPSHYANEPAHLRNKRLSRQHVNISVGSYENGRPTLTDGIFIPSWSLTWLGDFESASAFVLEKLGVSGLLQIICRQPGPALSN